MPGSIDRTSIEGFTATLRRRVLRGRTFACLVTTDAELRRLNHTFRGQDYATDVLSFPRSPLKNAQLPATAGRTDDKKRSSILREELNLGDLAISWQRAREQAREFGHSVECEIQVLMLHGVLHLAGMDHETDDGRMSRTETRWRRALGLPAGLIERVSA